MKPSILLKLLLGLAVSFSASAFAFSTNTGPKYVSRVWQTDEGLPHNFVRAITQTDDGWLWIGTRNGLARFDGMRFTVMDQTLFPKMKTRSFTALHQGRDGAFWIGTEGGGLICRKDGVNLIYTQTNGLPDNNIKTIYEADDGSMWIGTTGGLVQFKEGKPLVTLSETNGSRISVRAICDDHDGGILLGTSAGLARIKSGKVTMPYGTNLAVSINAVAVFNRSNIWAGLNKGLVRIQNGTAKIYSRQAGLADNFISALLVDRNKRLWVGTYGGLSYPVRGRFLTEPLSDEGTGDQVNCLFKDRENNLWVGTKDGLCRLRVQPVAMVNQQRGLTHNNVMSVMEDRAGSLWIGTWGGGPNCWENNTNTFVMRDTIDREFILSLCQSRDGAIWFGADYNHGLYRWSSEKPGTTRYNAMDGLANTAVRVIYEDHERNLWIGTSSSLHLFKDGKFTRYTTADGLAGNTIRVILEDRENNLWIGTTEGLSRIKNEKLKIQNAAAPLFTSYTTRDGLSHNAIAALHEDDKGDLWIGTDGGGLSRIKNEKLKMQNAETESSAGSSRITHHASRFTSYTTQQGLFSDTAFEIIEDDAGYFWMSCLNGIYRVKKQSFPDLDAGKITRLPCVAYGKAEGMTTPQCNGVSKPAGWKGKDGRLWFATTKGVAVIDPKNIKVNETPPPVVIEEVIADKMEDGKTGVRSSPSSILHPPSSLLIPPGRGELEIHYTTLSYTVPEKNQFKYQLEGIDSDWVDAGTRRVAYYNQLPPGDYTFRVQGCNNDGVWNELGANVKFTLQPHFWQTWWFRSSIVFASLFLVAAGARYATKRRIQLKLLRLEQQHALEKERTRIAQDMHDDLGARLSEILLIGDSAKKESSAEKIKGQVEKITDATRDLVDNLDAIVWAVNPKNDSLNRFALYVCEYAQMYLEATSLRYSVDVPDKLPDCQLSSEVRHNLFLVIKEALHNIVKHAQGSEVRLSLGV